MYVRFYLELGELFASFLPVVCRFIFIKLKDYAIMVALIQLLNKINNKQMFIILL